MSFYQDYRPSDFDELYGNEGIVESLQNLLESPDTFPKAVMLEGSSGTGKTTIARIIASKLDAELKEVNCADVRGLDDFRAIVSSLSVKPLRNSCKVLVLDEVHRLPTATQELLLKPLEDGVGSSKVILCTTDPKKIIKTVQTRCVPFHCSVLNESEMRLLLSSIAECEDIKLNDDVIYALIEASEGSARQALTILESISGLSTNDMIKHIHSFSNDIEVIELCRILMSKSPNWSNVSKILSKLDGEPEMIRRQVLGYSNVCLLKGNKQAYTVMNAFRDNYYDTGKCGLTLSAFEACQR